MKLETSNLDLDEDEEEYFTEIIVEINEELKNKSFYISIFHDPCRGRESTNKYNTNNAIRGENGKKQMRIERDYSEDFKLGILICGLDDLIGETLLIIYPIFYAKIDFEVDNEVEVLNELDNEGDNEEDHEVDHDLDHEGDHEGDNAVDKEVNINGIDTYFNHQSGLHKLIKIDCFLNPEGPRKLIKNKKFIEKGVKLLEEIELLSQLREGIMIHVINDNHNYSDYHSKLEKVDKFNEDEFEDFDNYSYLKPLFKEDFKFVEEENKNTAKKRKRNE
uniref:Uncharacterized protein n=1 Tax=Meloidogyne javanica TaxID=6303 RepID=A0A915LK72_MELJA